MDLKMGAANYLSQRAGIVIDSLKREGNVDLNITAIEKYLFIKEGIKEKGYDPTNGEKTLGETQIKRLFFGRREMDGRGVPKSSSDSLKSFLGMEFIL